MIFRPDRGTRGDDRFLHLKMLIFSLGAVLGIVGIARDIGWLIYAAIALLAGGILLRFVGRDAS